ncbi:carboxymuconolactone decarboxylase family protein [Sphaerisporangium sp. TRM90804]|uniref:carboxymuconolactone decarboxylase family protein n=1 Tax=Sphaerisporangium sp. TRM90804 TaxID=3031113 RepID=UPI00244BCC9E|nr:carboxymuconolactone decarboxylase family protein [Sphaerisporangium sp. TRM90804]MDH2428374.1 carboxymuconolactone decarboxylase family protein [Sphaerisporangium sp. TRM90804]
MGRLLARMTLPGTIGQVRHVTAVRPSAAGELVTRVYAQVERDFGMLAPPVLLHSPAPEVLAASWTTLRETLLAGGHAGRALKETVASSVSLGNACPYCVDVHKATLDGLVRGGDALDAASPATREIAAWAQASGVRGDAARHAPPMSPGLASELVGVAATFHYLNRMVNVFLGDSPLPPEVPNRARALLLRVFGLVMRPAARKAGTPGASLTLLPAVPAPADLAWAEAAPHVHGAFTRAAAAVDAAGARSIPAPVRELVTAELAAWDGTPRGPSRAWAADAVAGLPTYHRPAARLALLTAMASYQADAAVVDAFRADTPGDRELIELTSWSAMSAARRIATWIPVATPPADTRLATHP